MKAERCVVLRGVSGVCKYCHEYVDRVHCAPDNSFACASCCPWCTRGRGRGEAGVQAGDLDHAGADARAQDARENTARRGLGPSGQVSRAGGLIVEVR